MTVRRTLYILFGTSIGGDTHPVVLTLNLLRLALVLGGTALVIFGR